MLTDGKLLSPQTTAKMANLHYTMDNEPGITRKKRGKYFCYYDEQERLVKDKVTLQRIKSLAIPPAYTQVWICSSAEGHLQATGRDAKGRKQYRYHPEWRMIRDATKYHHILEFGQALPKIRRQVEVDIALPGLPKRKVLAAVVKLLESTLIRVGNAEYSRSNGSYGLTTLRKKHSQVSGNRVYFDFTGKSGQDWSIQIFDKKIAKVIKRCEEIPGYQLFKYLDEAGEKHGIDSSDVNNYLQEISGLTITAKDFRTWAGTVLAFMTLQAFAEVETAHQAKKNVVQAITSVAQRLGNTPSICRKCYIHPHVIESYLDGRLISQEINLAKRQAKQQVGVSDAGLRPEEATVLGWLQNLRACVS